MANALKPSNYLLCRHGAGRNPRARLRGPAEAGTARGKGAVPSLALSSQGEILPARSPSGRCSSRQRCRVVGVHQKDPLPKIHPREVVQRSSLSSTLGARSSALPIPKTEVEGREHDFCKSGKMEAKRGAGSWAGWYVGCLLWTEPKAWGSPPFLPTPTPAAFRGSS